MYKGILIKKSSTHNRLRTNEVTGVFDTLPTVGESFNLIGESLDPKLNFRSVVTSEIQEVSTDPECEELEFNFKTLNSEYKLKVLEVIE